jgi:hypothetical protein
MHRLNAPSLSCYLALSALAPPIAVDRDLCQPHRGLQKERS